MIQIGLDQRCVCRKPVRSGSWYLGRERCRGCNGFVITSERELAALRAAEQDEMRREQRFGAPATTSSAFPLGNGNGNGSLDASGR